MSSFSSAIPSPSCRSLLTTVALLIPFSAAVSGCGVSAATAKNTGYPAEYEQRTSASQFSHNGQQTRQQIQQQSLQQGRLREQFAGLITLYASLEADEVAEQARDVYAENLYFNDTLNSFDHRDKLIKYLEDTATKVEFNYVDITNIIPFGDDFFLQWKMSSGFKVMGRMIEAESIGMTHIRLDEQGKVNFHQDFWDNTQGLFQHLPIVGYIVRTTRDRL